MSSRRFISLREAQPPFFVGIDLGGTNLKVGVVDDDGRTLAWSTAPTEVDRGPENAARRIGLAVHEVVRDAGIELGAVARAGLGSPGTLDLRAGKMINPTNFPGWGGFPLRDRAAEHCKLPVAFVNDASAAAYGEFWVGSGSNFHSMILLTLGTGVGCGIIIGDLIIEGENGFGTECGHVLLDMADDARICSCGQRGHLEAYASAVAVVRRAREQLESGATTSLRARLTEGCELTPRLIADEAERHDAFCEQMVLDTGRYLGAGLVSLVHTIDPSGVLIGGQMTFGGGQSELGQRFIEAVRQEFRRRTFPLLAERTTIEFATLGGDAGYLGAAGMARLEYYKARSWQFNAPRLR